jgi:hypothetical protein
MPVLVTRAARASREVSVFWSSAGELYLSIGSGAPFFETQCAVEPGLSLYFDSAGALAAARVGGLSNMDRLVIDQSRRPAAT